MRVGNPSFFSFSSAVNRIRIFLHPILPSDAYHQHFQNRQLMRGISKSGGGRKRLIFQLWTYWFINTDLNLHFRFRLSWTCNQTIVVCESLPSFINHALGCYWRNSRKGSWKGVWYSWPKSKLYKLAEGPQFFLLIIGKFQNILQ